MDPVTLIIIMTLEVLTVGLLDNVITWYWAHEKAPKRAKELILNDPVFSDTRDKLDRLEVQVNKLNETELPALRHDMTVMQEGIRKDVKYEMTQFKFPELKVPHIDAPSLSLEAEDKLIRSFRGQASKAIKEIVAEEMKAEPGLEGEAGVAAISAEADAYQLAEYLVEQGCPEFLAKKAYLVGRVGLYALADRFGIEIPEAVDGTQGLYG